MVVGIRESSSREGLGVANWILLLSSSSNGRKNCWFRHEFISSPRMKISSQTSTIIEFSRSKTTLNLTFQISISYFKLKKMFISSLVSDLDALEGLYVKRKSSWVLLTEWNLNFLTMSRRKRFLWYVFLKYFDHLGIVGGKKSVESKKILNYLRNL